jgi:apolipoprotein N-acyltransferase
LQLEYIKIPDFFRRPIWLAISSGILFWASWPVLGFPLFIFFAFIPLFQIDSLFGKGRGRKSYFYIYLGLLIWNVLTTWWVYNSTPAALVAFTANAFLQSLPFLAFRFTKNVTNEWTAYLAFPSYWIAFEYLHLNWELSWPWLTLGNVFADFPILVQWFEYTGVLGGTLWILSFNISLFLFLKTYKRFTFPIWASGIFIIPILTSLFIHFSYEENGEPVEAAVIQPNIDPYSQKFEGSANFIPFSTQLKMFFMLSDSIISPRTRFLFWPETAIDDQIEESQISENEYIREILKYMEDKPELSLVTGLTTYTRYGDDPTTNSARFYEGFGYYDVFNTAFFFQKGRSPELYHKSRLVPGVEIMPYPGLFFFLQNLAIDLGGTSGGFGSQKERPVFFNTKKMGVAPAICYESIYGDFMSEYIRNGAGAIVVITNDAWWGDTPGYKQHMAYARLRAIEFRRPVIRSANTGISCFINQLGEVLVQTPYWEKGALVQEVKFNDQLTFYAEKGDYLGRIAAFLAIAFLLSAVTRKIASPRSK